jgi:hypothetical protein
MKEMSLQCSRMASVARKYCAVIDGDRDAGWIHRLAKLLPRLHVAIIALAEPSENSRAGLVYDDEKRCDMFLCLSDDLQMDSLLSAVYAEMPVGARQRQEICERMADNLADMYFDLKQGLAQLPDDPQCAAEIWQYTFYTHWGKHLLDAECWLGAVESGSEPALLPEWQWPFANGMLANPV